MTRISKEEKERISKINTMVLYDMGYYNINTIDNEMDKLLEEYKEIKIPESLDSWFNNYHKSLVKKENHQKFKKKIVKYFKNIAALIGIIFLSVSILTVSVEAFRINLFNLIIEMREKYGEITFENKSDNTINNENKEGYYPSYIPKGYKLDEIIENDISREIIYKNNNEFIYFTQDDLNMNYKIDTEDAEVSTIYINGYKAVLSIKNGYSIIIWTNNEYVFGINGQLEKEEIIKMAESVKIYE